MRTLIIIPAYNEQENIVHTVQDVRSHCPEMELLVVNDCSKDQTRKILVRERVNHLDLCSNLGIGGAVQAGYRYALRNDYDIAVQFDGDGQHDAAYLHALIQPLLDGRAEIAIGSRFIQKEGFQSSGARRAGILILNRLIRLLCGVRVLDVTSGMRAVDRRFIREFAEHYAQDYPEPEAILYAGLKNAVIQEVPVRMRERENGESSISGAWKSIYYMIKVTLALIMGRITIQRERTGGT